MQKKLLVNAVIPTKIVIRSRDIKHRELIHYTFAYFIVIPILLIYAENIKALRFWF